MTGVWALAALWLGLALIASLLSIWLRISTALSEIVVGTIAQLIIGAAVGSAILGTDESWVKFLAGIGAIGLTFGTISSLFGLSHGIIDQGQYSALIAAVIGSAVVPTVIANAFYLPRHLLPETEGEEASDGRREVTQLRAIKGRAE